MKNLEQKNSKIGKLVVLLNLTVILVALTGCELQDNAKKSAENSARAADNSEKVGNLSEQAYLDGRQAAARRTRAEEWIILTNAQTFSDKLVAASAYYCAYEFQLWKNSGIASDTLAMRDGLFTEAVREYFRQIEGDLSPFDLSSGDSFAFDTQSKHNLFALAATLDKVSHRQEEGSKKYNFTSTSFLTLFAEGSDLVKELNTGAVRFETLKPYQQELLNNYDKIQILLQARQAFLVQNLLKQVSPIAVPDPTTGSWKIDYSKLNLLQKEALIKLTKGVLQTRKILMDNGLKPLVPQLVAGKLTALDPTPKTEESSKGDQRTSELAALLGALKASQI